MNLTDERHHGVPRWAIGIGAAGVLHALAALFMARIAAPQPPPQEPVMMLELAPAPETPQADPAPQPEEPAQPQEATAPPPPPQDSPPDPTPVQTPVNQPPPDEPPPPETPPTPPPPEDVPVPPPPPAPKPAVIIPKRPPKPAVKPPPRPIQPPPSPEAAATSAPSVTAPQSSAAAQPQAATAAATADWRARLLAHLNRYKRYPAGAQMRHQQGVAYVRLILLPDGSVRGVQLRTSAGIESLDEEAVELVRRAQPLPPPPDISGAMELVIPIQFTLR
jgi:periplasmic protein TonB